MAIDTDNRVINRTCASLIQGIPYILHQGGTSSGKTFGILYSLLFFALKYLKPNSIVTIVSQNLPHLKKGAITDFKSILSLTDFGNNVSENKSDFSFTLPNGTIFQFYAPDDEEKAKSGKRDLLFMNEANGMRYSIAKQLMLRTNGPVILDWNPSGKFWLHRMLKPFLEPHEYIFTRSTYRDNKAANAKIIQEIERLKLIDPAQYEIYGLGIEGKGSEIIFPKFEIVESMPDTQLRGRGLDFGYTNDPSAGTAVALNEGALWYHQLFYERGLSNDDICARFELYPEFDGPIKADSAEPKSIAEIEANGFDISGCMKGPDSVKFTIDKMKSYPINVTRSSLDLIDELEGYKWIMKDGVPNNKPKGGNDHAIDSCRYGNETVLFDMSTPLQTAVHNARAMGFNQF